MNYQVEVVETQAVILQRRVTFTVEADSPEGAEAIASTKARCANRSLTWSDAVTLELPESERAGLQYRATVKTNGVDTTVRKTEEHGVESTCVYCYTRQNGLPESGPWRCKKCNEVNARGRLAVAEPERGDRREG